MDIGIQGKGREMTRQEGELHKFRQEIDVNIKRAGELKDNRESGYGREMALAYTKLQEAKMWVGKCLEAINSPFPENLRDEAK